MIKTINDPTNTSFNYSPTAITETYIINENTHKFHKPSCSSVSKMNEANKKEYTGDKNKLISEGYEACKNCNP